MAVPTRTHTENVNPELDVEMTDGGTSLQFLDMEDHDDLDDILETGSFMETVITVDGDEFWLAISGAVFDDPDDGEPVAPRCR